MQLGSCRICSYRSCDKIVIYTFDADFGDLRCIRDSLLRLRMLVRWVLLVHIILVPATSVVVTQLRLTLAIDLLSGGQSIFDLLGV